MTALAVATLAIGAIVTGPLASGAAADGEGEGPPYRPIVFPVVGGSARSFSDDFGVCRDGCSRSHQGNDVFAPKLTRLVAAVDGRITTLREDASGRSGNYLAITDAQGWRYLYIHVNNDSPGTDDGANPPQWRFAPGIALGATVRAGDFVGYVGDSGNAETTPPHLHFEIRTPGNEPINPYTSLRLALGLSAGGRCAYDANPARNPNGSLGPGYWSLGADGGIFTFGTAPFAGSTGGLRLNQPVVGMAATPTHAGYWLVARDGGIFAFGDARFLGSTGGIRLNQPIVGMAPTPSGNGYWLVASDGGIFTFGDAAFLGSTGGIRLNQPIVGMAPTPSGNGYWLVARDGGIFTFGDAAFFGSTGAIRLNQPIVGMTPTPNAGGYWLLAGDGGIFTFGNAGYHGSLPAIGLCRSPGAVAMVSTSTGAGYWIQSPDGRVRAFGDAAHHGDAAALRVRTIGFAALRVPPPG